MERDGGGTDALLAALAEAPDALPAGLAVGSQIGRYRVEAVVGRGGMGIVHRAIDTLLARPVALKVVLVDDATQRARLLREARAAAALNHPNVVTLHDVVEHDNRLCVVMELLDGRSLRSFIGGEVPMDRRIAWLRDIASALEVAHRAGLVHRDVKPENVMITSSGIVKVLDFGIARSSPSATGAHLGTLTAEGAAIGTPAYMAPEQIGGEPLDGRADQFAWGVVAYELLAGLRPWTTDGAASSVFAAILTEQPGELHVRDPAIPIVVSAAVARALSKKRDARFSSMGEVAAALEVSRESVRDLSVAAAPTELVRTPTDASTSGPGIDTPLRIDQAPLPTSDKPGAVEAYVEGLRFLRDGAWPSAFDAFTRATTIDPDLAPALLRRAIIGRTASHLLPGEMRATIRRASRHRMAARDVAMLRAFEPVLVFDPADLAEFHARLERLVAARPLDAELLAIAAAFYGMDGAAPHLTLAWAKRALEIDPDYADAWQMWADGTADDDEAYAALERSAEIAPSASDAWFHLAGIAAQRGDVKATEQHARRALALGAPFGDQLAGALYARGADRRAVFDAMTRYLASISPRQIASARARAEVAVAIVYGDFDRAEAQLASWAEALRDEDHNEIHSRWAMLRLLLLRERGEREMAAEVARDFLVGRETRMHANRVGRDEAALCLAACAAIADGPTRGRIGSERRAWLESSTDGPSPLGWALAYGFLLEDAPDENVIAEALASKPTADGILFRRHPLLRVDQALALRRLGDRARAKELFTRAARTINAPAEPFRSTLAHLHLGELLEEDGDADGAARAYGVVIERWGNAKSISADRARAGIARLSR